LGVPSSKFLSAVRTHAELAALVHQWHAVELYALLASYATLGLEPVKERLLRLLATAVSAETLEEGQMRTKLELALTQREIAEALACTPEHLSRVLARLKAENRITRQGRRLVLADATTLLGLRN
jgi:CRP-like cAMP-binding protein